MDSTNLTLDYIGVIVILVLDLH